MPVRLPDTPELVAAIEAFDLALSALDAGAAIPDPPAGYRTWRHQLTGDGRWLTARGESLRLLALEFFQGGGIAVRTTVAEPTTTTTAPLTTPSLSPSESALLGPFGSLVADEFRAELQARRAERLRSFRRGRGRGMSRGRGWTHPYQYPGAPGSSTTPTPGPGLAAVGFTNGMQPGYAAATTSMPVPAPTPTSASSGAGHDFHSFESGSLQSGSYYGGANAVAGPSNRSGPSAQLTDWGSPPETPVSPFQGMNMQGDEDVAMFNAASAAVQGAGPAADGHIVGPAAGDAMGGSMGASGVPGAASSSNTTI
ncbi:hypothetical protein GLOTRDRAFT_124935 [Gloeophyllum trabeum ATCC 11539]|uniref:Uncharacterized protein n=1 Tax=Gloeophyllum trabeum (strain ATCC 11539 / FP-39264 / Madison 617) TaxID=670483 RepID=S7S195_GLOTA|nr:uncharacterized protein GLOTRDRAFT_124935 [Gloeophyllum trabeum ATCC 11539]EPQ61205.1 hypothetical protein GLOTRDRAFT_124935 [Gloeophyllum trabeum ATCC 11539]